MQAGYLIKAGAIGKVVQTVNIAPHKVNDISRPDWFWDPVEYGWHSSAISVPTRRTSSFIYTGSTTVNSGPSIADRERKSSHAPQISGFWRHDDAR